MPLNKALDAEIPRDTAGQQTKSLKKRKKKQTQRRAHSGGGGAWRCYVNFHMAGKKWTALEIQELARQYRLLTPQEKRHFQEVGAAASCNHKMKGQTFPTSSRRARFARKNLALPRSHPTTDAASTVEHEKFLRALGAGESAHFPPSLSVENAPCSADMEPTRNAEAHVSHTLKVLSRVYRQAREEKRHAHNSLQEEVLSRSCSSAQHMLSSRRRLQNIGSCKWMGLPSEIPTLTSVFDPDDYPHLCVSQAASASSDAVASKLECAWQQGHKGVLHATCKVKEKRAPNRMCFLSGLCCCRGEGRHQHSVKQRLAKYFRDLSVDDSFANCLASGYIILHCCGASPLPATQSGQPVIFFTDPNTPQHQQPES